MKKKLFLIILALTLVFTMAPLGVYADTNSAGTRELTGSVTWDGIGMSSSSLPDYVKYDPSTGTLTIEPGAHSYTMANSSDLINVSGRLDLTIDVEGDLTVNSEGKSNPRLIENGSKSTAVKGPGSITASGCAIDAAGGISISGSGITADKIAGDIGSSIDISNGATINTNSIDTVKGDNSNVKISGGSKVTLAKSENDSDLKGAITTQVCSITDSSVSAEGGILTIFTGASPEYGASYNNNINITMTKPGNTVTAKSAIMALDEYYDEEESETATGGTGQIYLTGCAVSSPAGGKVSSFNSNVNLFGTSIQAKGFTITDQAGSTAEDIVIGYSSSYPKTGTSVKANGGKYKVTKSGAAGCEVQYTGPASRKSKAASISSTVSINGIVFKVTSIKAKALYKNRQLKKAVIGSNVKSIGKNAFYGDKKLKTIIIKSKKLKSVGKNAIRGISKKAVIKAPKSKLKKYKKIFSKKTGFKKTMKIKKY